LETAYPMTQFDTPEHLIRICQFLSWREFRQCNSEILQLIQIVYLSFLLIVYNYSLPKPYKT
jgi:hypothetical protein